MGAVLELAMLCFLEALISPVVWEKGVPEEEMRARQANLK
jgi:6-phospho-3-hexuloisomerase